MDVNLLAILLFLGIMGGVVIWSITSVVVALIARIKPPERPPEPPRERNQ